MNENTVMDELAAVIFVIVVPLEYIVCYVAIQVVRLTI